MTVRSRALTLTAEHVARVHRAVEDRPAAAGERQTDADYAGWVRRILAAHPAPDGPTHLFAYGSLIWKPEIPHVAERIGHLHGWHRAFCLRQHRFRGTPERPGLMMALDRGGACRGVLYELPADDLAGQFDRLFRREFTVKPITNMPRWVRAESDAGPVAALAFVMNRASPLYAGRLPPDAVAEVLAVACGHVGTGAEYLLNTVTHLEARGVHDRGLWKLQQLVAERIDRERPPLPDPAAPIAPSTPR
ncbi:MAG: gamma-glutamylcyclotransferase [Paracoccaceae bacterium]